MNCRAEHQRLVKSLTSKNMNSLSLRLKHIFIMTDAFFQFESNFVRLNIDLIKLILLHLIIRM